MFVAYYYMLQDGTQYLKPGTSCLTRRTFIDR